MQTYRLGISDIVAARIGYGCMYIGSSWDDTSLNDDDRAKALKALQVAPGAIDWVIEHGSIFQVISP